MTNPQAQKGVDKRGLPIQGLKDGKVTELAMFYTVKPGHEQAIREAIYGFCVDPKRDPHLPQIQKALGQIGIHEMRFVLFDKDTRLVWLTSFDSDWDNYIDDTILLVGIPPYTKVLMHTLEGPEGLSEDTPNLGAVVKDLFNAVRITAAGVLVSNADVSIKEQFRHRDVNRAFETVLNNPDAAEALQHAALKPLLELAAD